MNDRAQLVRYDAMCNAIAECHSVDEVTEIHDKALAMELYARQALNLEAERQAAQIRIRAEVKAGDLMRELERDSKKQAGQKKAHSTAKHASEFQSAIERAGISRPTAHRWQQLSDVAKSHPEKFEEALGEPNVVPTTSGILRAVNGDTSMDDDSLWLWGRLRDFERQEILGRGPREVYAGMTQKMQADVQRLIPLIVTWLMEVCE